MTSRYLRSRKIYWAISAVTLAAFLVAAVHWSNYYRIATYEMRWTTGEQAGFNSYGPNFDANGNPKVLVLLPGDQPHCFLISYSKDLFTYLRKENKPTVRVTLQLHYSYGKIYSYTILRFGDYDLKDELSEMGWNGSGSCEEHLDRYAEPPGPSERHD